MATRAQLAALQAAWTWDDDAYEDLADEVFNAKVDSYLGTIEALLQDLGYQLADGDQLELPDAVLSALEADSEAAARQIVATHNTDAAAFIERHSDQELDDLQDLLEDWEAQRATSKAPQVADHEVYGAHGDATVAFFDQVAAGAGDIEFDFGGHGDDAPKCELCRALLDNNPYTREQVLMIGTPHHGCAQNWHPRLDQVELPDEIDLTAFVTQGIASGPTLLQRSGSLSDAAAKVADL